jgi:hypothetical protein
MEKIIKVFADFNNADSKGRVRLNTRGALYDLQNANIILEEGFEVLLDDEDSLSMKGIIEYSEEERIWVARVDWNMLKRKDGKS